jgi:membrane protein DedA with SNARE-associated domain
MHSTITNLLQSHGYPALFLLVALESAGIPLPGETALVAAAAFAASGHLSIYVVIAIASAAAILGDNAGYWIGRKGGLPLVRRYGRFLHVDESRLQQAQKFFERHGAKAVFMGRFIALLRTWAAMLAGISCMRYPIFMFYNALGGAVWATLFGILGYLFGRKLPKLEHYIGNASLALALLVALVITMFVVWRWFRANRTRAKFNGSSIGPP